MKDFRIAQIVPVEQLNDIKDNQYHMCLAHLIGKEGQKKKYTEFYKKLAEQEDVYVLMDNGAAENSQLDFEELVAMYNYIEPNEIVVPDTLCDADDSLKKLDRFIRKYSFLPYKMMAVPQGRNLDEWTYCLKKMLCNGRIHSIGVSKFLNIKTGDKRIRYKALQIANRLTAEMCREDIEVHLLGCDEGPTIVGEIAMTFPIVRGCDSAYAYIATKAGKQITKNFKRPEEIAIDFLDDPMYNNYMENAKALEQLAGVTDNGKTETWRQKKNV